MMHYQASELAKVMTPEKRSSLVTGKLSFISEPGGKTRLIAIGDYWSQLVLRPTHDIIMRLLRKLETDGT